MGQAWRALSYPYAANAAGAYTRPDQAERLKNSPYSALNTLHSPFEFTDFKGPGFK